MTTPTDPGNDSTFAPWYDEGMPIPALHPIPWVYAEIYFSDVDKVEWRLYNYATDQCPTQTFPLASTIHTRDCPPCTTY